MALATVADVVPLTGLNRAFVVKGLDVMRQRRRPGLGPCSTWRAPTDRRPYHLGFLLGPRINAGGRIGDAALGVRLLTTADDLEARAIAFELDRLNRARQEIEIAALAEAEAEALLALGLEERGAAVVVAGETGRRGSSASSRRGSRNGTSARPSRSRLWAGTRPARPLDRGGRSRPRCARRSRRASWSRAADTRWRRA